MQYEHSTATVVREGLASCLLAWVLSPRWAACGLAPVWLGSALLSLSLCLSHLVLLCPVGLVRHWPNSARLKHTKHQGGSPRRFVCPPVVRVAFWLRCAIGDGRGLCYLYPSGAGPGGRDRYCVVHMRWAVPCLQLRIVWRASITMYCSTLQWFFYRHVVSAFVRR